MMRRTLAVLLWVVGLAAVATVSFFLWYVGLAATILLVPGELRPVHLVPAAIVGLAPLGWYIWNTLFEPLRLRDERRPKGARKPWTR